MFRGEFRRADGLVVPNNITLFGLQQILAMAFRSSGAGVAVAPAGNFYVALVKGNPGSALQLENLAEPTLGVNGYARQPIERSAAGWPTIAAVNQEAYIESAPFIFAASGGPFDRAYSRMALLPSGVNLTGNVFALSAAFPNERVIGVDTGLVDRTFTYRVYVG